MASRWAERFLGWGLSLSLHIGAFLGATLLVFYPGHWCVPMEEVRVVHLQPTRILDLGDERDLVSRRCLDWFHPDRWNGDPGMKDGLGGPPGFTLHGTEGWDRRRSGRHAESAILAALRWLARHQDPQGSWGFIKWSCPCEPETEKSVEELTALVLQTFRAAGYGADSKVVYVDPTRPDLDLPFGEVIERGLSHLRFVYDRDLTAEPAPYLQVPVDDGPILKSQKTAADGCSNGSWDPPSGGRVACAARNTLRLIAARNR